MVALIENNCIKMVMYTILVALYVTNSVVVLGVYLIVIHTLLIIFISGLYAEDEFYTRAGIYVENMNKIQPLYIAIDGTVFITLLVATKSWYTLCVTALYMVMVLIYVSRKGCEGEEGI